MKFNELDSQMRVFETAHDYCVLPGIHIVARLDGRSFTRLTKDVHRFEAPFDPRFRDLMLETTEALLTEFNAIYGYTQSDEILLLFPFDCGLFSRKLRKLNSVLAGYASAGFALGLGAMASFDCRVCELPQFGMWWTTSAGETRTPTAMRSTPIATGCCAARANPLMRRRLP